MKIFLQCVGCETYGESLLEVNRMMPTPEGWEMRSSESGNLEPYCEKCVAVVKEAHRAAVASLKVKK